MYTPISERINMKVKSAYAPLHSSAIGYIPFTPHNGHGQSAIRVVPICFISYFIVLCLRLLSVFLFLLLSLLHDNGNDDSLLKR